MLDLPVPSCNNLQSANPGRQGGKFSANLVGLAAAAPAAAHSPPSILIAAITKEIDTKEADERRDNSDSVQLYLTTITKEADERRDNSDLVQLYSTTMQHGEASVIDNM